MTCPVSNGRVVRVHGAGAPAPGSHHTAIRRGYQKDWILKKTLLVLAAAGTLSLTGIAPASADVSDGGGAALSNTLDMAEAALGNTDAALADPNTTCKVTATGNVLVQRTNALVADVFAQNVIVGAGTCISLSPGTYTGTVKVVNQYYVATSATTGSWVDACSASTPASSVAGVLQPVPTSKLCSYAFPSAALNRYHRAVATLTNSRGQKFVDISPIWFLTP